MVDISVILCCYNGKARLRLTLEHLAMQKVSPSLRCEFVFVDNASTDGSAEFVRSVWNELGASIELRIIREERAGLIYARECGVHAARGKYIIFCDDDNWLRDDYFQTAYDLIQQMPNVGVLGGQSVLSPGVEAPGWWEDQQGNYAVGRQLPNSGLANKRGYLYGAGMVTRTDLARKIFDDRYPFLLTGRKGDKCLSGEDGEYCTRVRFMGFDLFYSERLFYWHDVAPERLTHEQLQKLLQSFFACEIINNKYAYALNYVKQSRWNHIVWLFIRVGNYVFASSKNKNRKKELLYFHLYLMGLIRTKDFELEVIKNFMKYSQKASKCFVE